MRRLDVLLALASGITIAVATGVASEPSSQSSGVAAATLGLVMGVLLLFRRARPVLVLILSLIAVMGYNLTDFPGVSPIWPLLVPLYTVARAGQPLIGAAVGAATLLVSTGWVLHAGVGPLELLDGVLREAALLALALVAGAAIRNGELFAREAAARLAAEQAQQKRESARLVLAERIRIARELHDVTAHTVAVVGIQVNLARELIATDPEAARELLDRTRQVNVDAIAELQRAVRLLREPGSATEPDRRSPPDETLLPDLLDRASDAGLRTTLSTDGEPRALPPTIGLTLYRIAQESVTNVLRHANAGSVAVTLHYAADGVGLDIVDDGTGRATDDAPGRAVEPGAGRAVAAGTGLDAASGGPLSDSDGGHGLTGMRERAGSLGGTLRAGPRPEGGYAVHAWLPLAAPRGIVVEAASSPVGAGKADPGRPGQGSVSR